MANSVNRARKSAKPKPADVDAQEYGFDEMDAAQSATKSDGEKKIKHQPELKDTKAKPENRSSAKKNTAQKPDKAVDKLPGEKDIPPWEVQPEIQDSAAEMQSVPEKSTNSESEPQPQIDAQPPRQSRGAITKRVSRQSKSDGESRTRPFKARQGDNERAARDEKRYMLTLIISGEEGDQFDVLVDGRAYWGGSEPPYKFEIMLTPGEHKLRVRQRHPMDKQPSEFVPLPLAIMLGDGKRSEIGPYFAALDARINISADAKLTVKYSQTGQAGLRRAMFNCTPGKGMECEVLDTSMSTTPRLARRWKAANYFALGMIAALALAIVWLGAYMCVRPDGNVSGGLILAAIGAALAIGCACLNGTIRTALDGGYTPDMEFPKPKKKRAAKPAGDGSFPPDDGDGAAAEPDESSQTQKPRRKKSSGKPPKRPQRDIDYDGAYDDADEMGEFEESGLSTADLSPEQLRAAKRQLLKKLGGEDDSPDEDLDDVADKAKK